MMTFLAVLSPLPFSLCIASRVPVAYNIDLLEPIAIARVRKKRWYVKVIDIDLIRVGYNTNI